jgi:hypothetical protein
LKSRAVAIPERDAVILHSTSETKCGTCLWFWYAFAAVPSVRQTQRTVREDFMHCNISVFCIMYYMRIIRNRSGAKPDRSRNTRRTAPLTRPQRDSKFFGRAVKSNQTIERWFAFHPRACGRCRRATNHGPARCAKSAHETWLAFPVERPILSPVITAALGGVTQCLDWIRASCLAGLCRPPSSRATSRLLERL